mmetsp:Transcript_58839/g.187840  ORF Transcript_58839/g.187840 Transcript_58839/m.187840 type:complete len:202 (+) Transcript_58839:2020-2625(+)
MRGAAVEAHSQEKEGGCEDEDGARHRHDDVLWILEEEAEGAASTTPCIRAHPPSAFPPSGGGASRMSTLVALAPGRYQRPRWCGGGGAKGRRVGAGLPQKAKGALLVAALQRAAAHRGRKAAGCLDSLVNPLGHPGRLGGEQLVLAKVVESPRETPGGPLPRRETGEGGGIPAAPQAPPPARAAGRPTPRPWRRRVHRAGR